MLTNKLKQIIYDITMAVLALISVIITIADLCGKVAYHGLFWGIDKLLLGVFAVDYIVRLLKSDNKQKFIKSNVIDLISIIPFDSAFSILRTFRVFRAFRLVKLFKFAKLLKIFARLDIFKKRLSDFLHINGFIYALYTAGILIFTSSVIMSHAEKQSFFDALWWSIVTCTTVGYGDISPSSAVGRVTAIILMIFGIGLISMLTSTITEFFTQKRIKAKVSDNSQELIDMINALDENQQKLIAEIIKNLPPNGRR